MPTHLLGSKKKARAAARERRLSNAFKKRLARIYELARLIRDENELTILLDQIPDEEVRAETRKLITPFLLFQVGDHVQGPAPDALALDDVADLAAESAHLPPAKTLILTDAPERVH
jgi:hypothetical protein